RQRPLPRTPHRRATYRGDEPCADSGARTGVAALTGRFDWPREPDVPGCDLRDILDLSDDGASSPGTDRTRGPRRPASALSGPGSCPGLPPALSEGPSEDRSAASS